MYTILGKLYTLFDFPFMLLLNSITFFILCKLYFGGDIVNLTYNEAVRGFRELLNRVKDVGYLKFYLCEVFEEFSSFHLCYLDKKHKPKWMSVFLQNQSEIKPRYIFKIEILNKNFNVKNYRFKRIDEVMEKIDNELSESKADVDGKNFYKFKLIKYKSLLGHMRWITTCFKNV